MRCIAINLKGTPNAPLVCTGRHYRKYHIGVCANMVPHGSCLNDQRQRWPPGTEYRNFGNCIPYKCKYWERERDTHSTAIRGPTTNTHIGDWLTRGGGGTDRNGGRRGWNPVAAGKKLHPSPCSAYHRESQMACVMSKVSSAGPGTNQCVTESRVQFLYCSALLGFAVPIQLAV